MSETTGAGAAVDDFSDPGGGAVPAGAGGRGVPELVCLDMAGTTVADGGMVEAAFTAALDQLGVPAGSADRPRMLRYVRETMGRSKIEVFRALFTGEARAQAANSAFEHAFDAAVRAGMARPIDGAVEAIAAIRARGAKVALTTGFSAGTQQLLIESLGWLELADLTLCPGEGVRGRPYPDMILSAVLRLGVSSVASVVVVGDTASDMASGRSAGAGRVVGVESGADDAERLLAGGATEVIASVAALPGLLDLG